MATEENTNNIFSLSDYVALYTSASKVDTEDNTTIGYLVEKNRTVVQDNGDESQRDIVIPFNANSIASTLQFISECISATDDRNITDKVIIEIYAHYINSIKQCFKEATAFFNEKTFQYSKGENAVDGLPVISYLLHNEILLRSFGETISPYNYVNASPIKGTTGPVTKCKFFNADLEVSTVELDQLIPHPEFDIPLTNDASAIHQIHPTGVEVNWYDTRRSLITLFQFRKDVVTEFVNKNSYESPEDYEGIPFVKAKLNAFKTVFDMYQTEQPELVVEGSAIDTWIKSFKLEDIGFDFFLSEVFVEKLDNSRMVLATGLNTVADILKSLKTETGDSLEDLFKNHELSQEDKDEATKELFQILTNKFKAFDSDDMEAFAVQHTGEYALSKTSVVVSQEDLHTLFLKHYYYIQLLNCHNELDAVFTKLLTRIYQETRYSLITSSLVILLDLYYGSLIQVIGDILNCNHPQLAEENNVKLVQEVKEIVESFKSTGFNLYNNNTVFLESHEVFLNKSSPIHVKFVEFLKQCSGIDRKYLESFKINKNTVNNVKMFDDKETVLDFIDNKEMVFVEKVTYAGIQYHNVESYLEKLNNIPDINDIDNALRLLDALENAVPTTKVVFKPTIGYGIYTIFDIFTRFEDVFLTTDIDDIEEKFFSLFIDQPWVKEAI